MTFPDFHFEKCSTLFKNQIFDGLVQLILGNAYVSKGSTRDGNGNGEQADEGEISYAHCRSILPDESRLALKDRAHGKSFFTQFA
jgi:hypothetical protein